MASVLVIGINYRPEATGIAPYTTALAEHLASSGHGTTVITGFPHYPAWRVDPGDRRLRTDGDVDGVRVLRRRHYVPGSQSAIRRAIYEASFLAHGFVSRPARPDLVIGVVPSLSGGLLARLFAARARAPYAVVVQDLMSPAAAQSGIRGGRRVAGATAALERWGARRASVVAVAADAFRPYVTAIGVAADRIMSFPNWAHVAPPPSQDSAAIRERFDWPAGTSVVLHAGNMGLKQGLGQVIAAARDADDRALDILYVLVGDGSQRADLVAEAAGIRRIRFLPFQPENELPAMLGAADVLLVSERETVVDMSLPSKLTTYFAAGRPVVAAVPDAGSTAAEVRRSGGGIVVPVGDPRALNDAVAHLAADAAAGVALGRAGRQYATVTLGEAAAMRRVDELVARLLAARRDGGTG